MMDLEKCGDSSLIDEIFSRGLQNGFLGRLSDSDLILEMIERDLCDDIEIVNRISDEVVEDLFYLRGLNTPERYDEKTYAILDEIKHKSSLGLDVSYLFNELLVELKKGI
jgi:hypothetical protein